MEDRQTSERFLTARTEESFGPLFESYYPRVRRYFRLRGLDAGEAEDLAQNVMFIVYRRASEVREPALFTGWLFKVAKNELARHWRRQQARHRIAPFEPLTDELAGRLSMEMEAFRHSNLHDWLSRLEPAERDLVLLRYVEELSYEELAAALDIPIGTVKWRLFQVKKRLIPIIGPTLPERATKRTD